MAFLDFLSESTIRNAFLSGKCSFVLDRNASVLLWLDGAALSFFGFSSLTDALDREEIFDSAVKRQIENGIKSGRPVHLRGKSGAARSFNLSLISGETHSLNEMHGKNAPDKQKQFIFVSEVRSTGAANGSSEAANEINRNLLITQPEALLEGLEDNHISAAIFGDGNEILAKTENFQPLGDTLQIFLSSIDGFSPVKTLMKNGGGKVQVNAIRLCETPQRFLILCFNIATIDENAAGQNNQKRNEKPARFTWQMDKNGAFSNFSDAFYDCGGDAEKLLGRSLADLDNEYKNAGFLSLEEKISQCIAFQDEVVRFPTKREQANLEVSLSGLPVLSLDGKLDGFRGFGTVKAPVDGQLNPQNGNRDVDSVATVENKFAPQPEKPVENETIQSQLSTGSAPEDADKTALGGQEKQSNQTLQEQDTGSALNSSERSAFREIAERLRSELQLPAVARPLSKALKTDKTAHDEQLSGENKFIPERSSLLNLLDTATDGFVFLNNDGSIEGFSAAASALTGYDKEDVAGRPFKSLFRTTSEEAINDYLAALESGGAKRLFNRGQSADIQTKSGDDIRVFVTLVPLTNQKGYAGLLRDMTNVSVPSQPIYDNEVFAQTIHEIRTPLNAMIGFADIMREERFGRIENERYRGYLRDIVSSGKHILSLVNSFLEKAKSRYEEKTRSGETNSETAIDNRQSSVPSFDVIQQLRKSVALFENQANENGIIIRITMPPKIPAIGIEAQEFRQIIFNLLSNAIRFTQRGGQIVVHLSTTDKNYVKLSVSDNGIGMNEEEMARALQPYGQVARKDGRAGDAVFTGTGLGLPTTKGLVEKIGGRLILLSRPGQGTTVEVFFPVHRL
ncbi:PAS domain-containing sensor histidine kinase [Bartonella sp. W8125]|uniref:PAS domain-containing sensor histidine kinase n=1 Tax=Bartonella TaxID=773 RepID=UPI0018DDB04A|nr:PAS domain-containing sensor histidine kinase [Bartonella choladocola]MBI0141522.1 PAS domain-containing sensor histidine kinase [Bartonella choladocola]